jgi:hypothetical protein
MNVRVDIVALTAAAVLPNLAPATAAAQQVPTLVLQLETGAVWQSYNDVEIPNDGSATRFTLRRHRCGALGVGPTLPHLARQRAPWPAPLLAAPLSITETGNLAAVEVFAGQTYSPGIAKATYTFNSYRLSYRYRFHSGERTTAWVGFTAKVRDAVIRLEQNGTASEKTDRGFVPLLHPGRRLAACASPAAEPGHRGTGRRPRPGRGWDTEAGLRPLRPLDDPGRVPHR